MTLHKKGLLISCRQTWSVEAQFLWNKTYWGTIHSVYQKHLETASFLTEIGFGYTVIAKNSIMFFILIII